MAGLFDTIEKKVFDVKLDEYVKPIAKAAPVKEPPKKRVSNETAFLKPLDVPMKHPPMSLKELRKRKGKPIEGNKLRWIDGQYKTIP